MNATKPDSAAAWLFAMQHSPIIERYARCDRFRRNYTDVEEFERDLMVDVVERLELLDPGRLKKARPCPYCDRKGCASWIFTRAMLTRTRHDRRHARRLRHVPLDRAPEPSSECTSIEAFERTTDARVKVTWLLSVATPGQQDAALSLLEGWEDDAPEILGISRGTYRNRLRELRAVAGGYSDERGGYSDERGGYLAEAS